MKTSLLTFFIAFTLLFSSCITTKKVVYVRDMISDTAYSVLEAPLLRIQKNDRLSIVVSAKTPELAVPFNQGSGEYQVNTQGSVSRGSSSAPINGNGYLVDDSGEIEFPILGTFQVDGQTIEQIKTLIKNKLVEERFISDPIIKVELLNLKISMMGEINSVGILDVPDARITLLEAITRSGGLTSNATPNKISVIREENGVRNVYINDIESRDIFNSPTFYLQQNDIVYVEPLGAELSPKAQNNWRLIGIGTGLITTVFSILTFLK